MEDTIIRATHLEKNNTRNRKLKVEKEMTTGIKTKLGRPSKYE